VSKTFPRFFDVLDELRRPSGSVAGLSAGSDPAESRSDRE
jgi:hypothetical protein